MALLRFPIQRENRLTPEERREALALGRLGEQMATKYLEEQGYAILERNYHKGHLEIDIIALEGDELVVVEVKTRADDTVLSPEGAVDHKKRLSLIRLANQYVKSHDRTENIRLDVLTVVKNEKGVVINHIKDAFTVMNF